MADPARQADIIDLGEYLDKAISELDDTIRELQATRTAWAIRRSVLRAAGSKSVQQAAAELDQRVKDGRPYEDAKDAAELIQEAHRRLTS